MKQRQVTGLNSKLVGLLLLPVLFLFLGTVFVFNAKTSFLLSNTSPSNHSDEVHVEGQQGNLEFLSVVSKENYPFPFTESFEQDSEVESFDDNNEDDKRAVSKHLLELASHHYLLLFSDLAQKSVQRKYIPFYLLFHSWKTQLV